MPNLAYSISKFKGEEIIKKSSLDYFILRLGSVYGYTENEKRMFNMPNLFQKKLKKCKFETFFKRCSIKKHSIRS